MGESRAYGCGGQGINEGLDATRAVWTDLRRLGWRLVARTGRRYEATQTRVLYVTGCLLCVPLLLLILVVIGEIIL